MRNFTFGFLLFLISIPAASAPATTTRWYFANADLLLGYGQSATPADSQPATVGSTGLDLNFGLRYKHVGLGVSLATSFLTQYSDVKVDVGNRRGQVTAVGNPVLQISLGSLDFRYTMIMSSSYALSNQSFVGSAPVYKKPSGYQALIAFHFPSSNKNFDKVDILLWTGSTVYSESSLSGALSSKLSVTVSGLGVSYGI